MRSAVDHDKDHLQPGFFVSNPQLVRLIERHLRVLVAVQQYQRRISWTDMSYRAGQFCRIPRLFGQSTEEQLQVGFADLQAGWS